MSILRSRVRESTSVNMARNCWQESCGFLTTRGDQAGDKRKRNAHTDEDVEEGRDINEDDEDVEEGCNIDEDDEDVKEGHTIIDEDDEEEVLADQSSPIHCNGSLNYINRVVQVGTSIKPDSNVSIKDKRPKYFSPTEGGVNLNFCDGNVWRVMERITEGMSEYCIIEGMSQHFDDDFFYYYKK